MLNQQIVAFRSVETDIQPFTAEPDTQTTLLHQVENAPELPYGHRFAMPQRGSCQAANQTGSDRTPLPIQSVVIRGYPWCQTHPRPSIHTNSRPLPCLPWFNSIPVPSVFRGVHPWFQIQPPNHTRTGSGGTSPSPKKHPRPSIRTNSRPLPCVPCPPSFKKTPNCTRFSSDGNLPTHSIRSTVARSAGGSSRGGQLKNAAEIHRFPDRGRRRRLI